MYCNNCCTAASGKYSNTCQFLPHHLHNALTQFILCQSNNIHNKFLPVIVSDTDNITNNTKLWLVIIALHVIWSTINLNQSVKQTLCQNINHLIWCCCGTKTSGYVYSCFILLVSFNFYNGASIYMEIRIWVANNEQNYQHYHA